MRRIALALGDHYALQGKLGAREDIFYLQYDEVCALAREELPSELAQSFVEQRKAQMAIDAGLELPVTIRGEYEPPKKLAPYDDAAVLSGIPGSSGRVEGMAHVLRDPADAPPNLSKEDILVVPFTDVGWTPLFPSIGGIVAETGGQLSHTSIVAREYGLPAVVSVDKATTRIKHGQFIILDGDDGRVYLRNQ